MNMLLTCFKILTCSEYRVNTNKRTMANSFKKQRNQVSAETDFAQLRLLHFKFEHNHIFMSFT